MITTLMQINALRPTFTGISPNIQKDITHIRMTIDKIDYATEQLRREWLRLNILRDQMWHGPFFMRPSDQLSNGPAQSITQRFAK